MQSIRENDFECLTSTGVNASETMFLSLRVDGVLAKCLLQQHARRSKEELSDIVDTSPAENTDVQVLTRKESEFNLRREIQELNLCLRRKGQNNEATHIRGDRIHLGYAWHRFSI